MNKTLLAIAFVAASATATAETTADLWASTDYLYRGSSLSHGEAALGLNYESSDVLIPGLSVNAGLAVWDFTGRTGDTVHRADVGVAYSGDLAYDLKYTVGVNRVLTNDVFAADYSEVRGRLSRDFGDRFTVFGELGYSFTDAVSNDLYTAVGVSYAVSDSIWVAGAVSAVDSEFRNSWNHNHAEVKAGWDVTSQFGVFAQATYGNRDLGLDNEWAVGGTYRF